MTEELNDLQRWAWRVVAVEFAAGVVALVVLDFAVVGSILDDAHAGPTLAFLGLLFAVVAMPALAFRSLGYAPRLWRADP